MNNKSWQWPYDDDEGTPEELADEALHTDPRVESLKRGLTSAEADYVQECWSVFLLAIKQGNLLTFDVEEALPDLPFNVTQRQGYMLRQTLLDIAIQVDREQSPE